MSDRELTDLLQKIVQVLNGGVEFGSTSAPTVNIKGVMVKGVTPGVANTDFNLTHNLGFTPNGWLVVSKDQYSDFKKGVTVWNNITITLQCNTTGVNYLIFIF